jgi:hypothetical protein
MPVRLCPEFQMASGSTDCIRKRELLPFGGLMAKIISLVLLIGVVLEANAASIYKQSLSQKSNKYASNAVFMGGRAEKLQSLMKVRRVTSTKVGIERVILDLGSENYRAIAEPGYFHVSVDGNNSRVVIQLGQMSKTLITEQQIRKVFAKSSNVKSVEFTVDPEDSTGSVVLNLKRPVKAEVFSLPGRKKQTARLVLDLKPVVKK